MATIQFKGKEIVRNYHLTVPYHELVPDGKKSLTKKVSLNDNLIIHGDNLLALKALLPTYAGKVKCIYIDPPYNTGNEKWAYNDNVNSPMMKEWLGKVVDKDDLTRHDKWLCMMTPRIKILRELLRDDGAIFISIDDNEHHRLRILMDEIFGEENFVTSFSIKANPRGRQSDENIATLHEYCLCYARNNDDLDLHGLPMTQEYIDEYGQTDEDGKKWRELGLRQRGAASLREDRRDMFFPIYVNPNSGAVSLDSRNHYTIEVLPRKSDGRDGRWMWSSKKVAEEISRVYSRKVSGREEFDIFIKDYLERDGEQRTTKPRSMWLDAGVNTELGGKLLKLILGKKTIEYPKPLELLKRIVQIATDKDSIVLDSFSGSGTTAHAVLALNKENGGNRKFILVEMEDYADDITAQRVRRVIKGVKRAKDESLQKGLGDSFSYYELGKPIDAERILKGKDLPTFAEMARYIFYTATGEEFNEKKVNEKTGLIGESKEYQVYLLYKPDMEYLKSTALTLERAEALGKFSGKKRLVFAPAKYLDQEHLERLHIDFAQLPFEIYQKQ
jgi:adenine-specific DNA-methyltransferase